MITEFQPVVFVLTFSVTQLISLKFPEIKFFLMRKSKRLRIHHAFAGGLLALFASFIGQPILLNVGLGGMIQDIFDHSIKILRKFFNHS
jgi:hypothetical protein